MNPPSGPNRPISEFGLSLRRARENARLDEIGLSAISGVMVDVIRAIENGSIRSPSKQIQDQLSGAIARYVRPDPAQVQAPHLAMPPTSYLSAPPTSPYPQVVQALPGQTETIVREYTRASDFHNDAARLAKQGWTVVSQTEIRPRAGCARLLLLWWIVLIFPPKPKIVVTYQRQRPMR